MNKAELHAQIEAMTDEEAAEAVLVYAPDWPDKITPIAEVTPEGAAWSCRRLRTARRSRIGSPSCARPEMGPRR